MKRFASLTLAVLVALTAATTASAGPADLHGDWIVESFNGENPPPNMQMKITFGEDGVMTMTVTVDGQDLGTEEARYEADDNTITVYTDDEPGGDSASWSIGFDGKLTIVSEEDNETIVMSPA